MIKLKKLLKESTWVNRKFGEPLPTIKDYMEAQEEKLEMHKVYTAKDRPPFKTIKEVSGQDIRKLEKNLDKTYKAYVAAILKIGQLAEKEIDTRTAMKIYKEYKVKVMGFHQWITSWMRKEL